MRQTKMMQNYEDGNMDLGNNLHMKYLDYYKLILNSLEPFHKPFNYFSYLPIVHWRPVRKESENI